MSKYFKISFIGLLIVLLAGNCTTRQIVVTKPVNNSSNNASTVKKNLPPGQAKKVYGTQSAKPFAPGQQKKKKN